MTSMSRTIKSSGVPLSDPQATCAACGVLGTIGRIVRMDEHSAVLDVQRFCRACWPTQRDRSHAEQADDLRARHDAFVRNPDANPTPGFGYDIGAASWHGVLELIQDMEAAMRGPVRVTPAQLAVMCDGWPDLEREFGEPMPPEARAFYNAHRSGAS